MWQIPSIDTIRTKKRAGFGIGGSRRLGGILLAMKALSLKSLEVGLKNFDPRRDGHMGVYLVGRGLVTQRQLDEALRHQEAASTTPGGLHAMPWSTA